MKGTRGGVKEAPTNSLALLSIDHETIVKDCGRFYERVVQNEPWQELPSALPSLQFVDENHAFKFV